MLIDDLLIHVPTIIIISGMAIGLLHMRREEKNIDAEIRRVDLRIREVSIEIESEIAYLKACGLTSRGKLEDLKSNYEINKISFDIRMGDPFFNRRGSGLKLQCRTDYLEELNSLRVQLLLIKISPNQSLEMIFFKTDGKLEE